MKKPREVKDRHATFRMTPRLKDALEAAAKSSRRTLSQEIEFRLEQSFIYEKTIGDVKQYERMRKRAIRIQSGEEPSPGRFIEEAEVPPQYVTEEQLREEIDTLRKSIAEAMTPKKRDDVA